MKNWQILKKGTFTDINNKTVVVDDAVLDAVVAYAQKNAQAREVPIVKGHPKVDSPKWGGIALSSFKRDGDYLVAEPRWLDNQLREEIVKGHYDACSLKFSPVTGKIYHLGVLGAHDPAVPGLEVLSLAELESDDDAVHVVSLADGRMPVVAAIMRRLRDKTIEEKGLEIADSIFDSSDIASLESYLPEVPEWVDSSINALWGAIDRIYINMEQKTNNLISLGRSEKMTLEEQLLQEKAARLAAEKVAEEAKKRNRTLEIEAALSAPELAGRITPAMKPEIAAIMHELTEIDSLVEFASGTGEVIKKPILESFKGILSQLPQAVAFGSPSVEPPAKTTVLDEAAELAAMANRGRSK